MRPHSSATETQCASRLAAPAKQPHEWRLPPTLAPPGRRGSQHRPCVHAQQPRISAYRPRLRTAASRPRRNSPSQVVTCEAAGRVRGARNPRGDSVPAAPWVSGGRPTRWRRRRRRLSRPYLPVTVAGGRGALPRYATKKGASVPPCVAGAPYTWLGASPTRLSRGWAIAAAGSAAVAGSRAGPRSSSRSAGAGRGGPAEAWPRADWREIADAAATRPRRSRDSCGRCEGISQSVSRVGRATVAACFAALQSCAHYEIQDPGSVERSLTSLTLLAVGKVY
jgi:hypothetical protein